VLSDLPVSTDERVLVDFRTADDAGVYDVGGGIALVQTVDFFTPIVDDPDAYGRIAAVNAMNDVYAMGGTPVTALAIAAFPDQGLPREVIRSIFAGGLATLRADGVALLGGHTVQDPEVKFGYAVTGLVDPARILTNAGARPGDRLLLTKAVGTGIAATAIKAGRAPENVIEAAVSSMTTSGRTAAQVVGRQPPGTIHACTDVTGFGLVGHASEVAAASAVTLRIRSAAVPILEGVGPLVRRHLTAGGSANRRHFASTVRIGPIPAELDDLLHDPQTAGGFLVAVTADRADVLVAELGEAGITAWAIGDVVERGSVGVEVT